MTSNDPKNRTTRLSVSVLIEVEFGFESYSVHFGRMKMNDTLTKTTSILIKHPEQVKITDITTSSPFVLAKQTGHSDSADGHAKIEVEVTLLPGLPLGRINATVTARSNQESKPEATLHLNGSIVGDVEVVPDMLRFLVGGSGERSNQVTSQLVKITNSAKDKPLQILGARDPDDRLQLDIETIEKGRVFEITATLKPEALAASGYQTGTIVITTDNQEYKEMTVRYNIRHQ